MNHQPNLKKLLDKSELDCNDLNIIYAAIAELAEAIVKRTDYRGMDIEARHHLMQAVANLNIASNSAGLASVKHSQALVKRSQQYGG